MTALQTAIAQRMRSRRTLGASLWRRWMFGWLVVVLALCGGASNAFAFHVGSLFQKAPGAGGAGRIYYTGAPLERGWTCTMCHNDAPGEIRIRVDVAPASLFDDFRYAPGQRYTFTVTLLNQSRGIAAGQSNFNTLGLSITDAQGLYAGLVDGFDAANFFRGGDTVIVSAGTAVNEESWSFDWTAPDAGAGIVTVYFGVVDGNGADSEPTETRTDPFGDDVFAGSITLQPGASSATSSAQASKVGTAAGYPPPVRQDHASVEPKNQVRSQRLAQRTRPTVRASTGNPKSATSATSGAWLAALLMVMIAAVTVGVVSPARNR